MPPVRRLTLAFAAVAALTAAAATPAAAGTTCRVNPSHGCARNGAACGTRKAPGVCLTYRRALPTGRFYPVCVCRPKARH